VENITLRSIIETSLSILIEVKRALHQTSLVYRLCAGHNALNRYDVPGNGANKNLRHTGVLHFFDQM